MSDVINLDNIDPDQPVVEDYGSYIAILAVMGVFTGDRRYIEPGVINHRDLPVPLMVNFTTTEHHMDAEIAGNIESIWIDAENRVWGSGRFDRGEAGQKARQMIKDGMLRGVSVDLDDFDATLSEDDNGPFMKITKGRIMGSTLTPFPAMQEAQITMIASGDEVVGVSASFDLVVELSDSSDNSELGIDAVLASGRMPVSLNEFPVEPPAFWFDNPELNRLQPVTVDKNGRVFGHVAAWGSCHISFKDCRDVPKCGTYKKFMNKTTLCDDGSLRPSGAVFIGTDHAKTSLLADVASDHYANTGAAVADVSVYEDRFGLCIAGAVRPNVSPEAVRVFRGSDISPDWRKVRTMKNKQGKWELVGLLSVNTSGFVVDSLLASGAEIVTFDVEPSAGFVDGELVSLVASGVVSRQRSDADRIADLESELDALKLSVAGVVAAFDVKHEPDGLLGDVVDESVSLDVVSDEQLIFVLDEVSEPVLRRFGWVPVEEKQAAKIAELKQRFIQS